ncbi:MFS general substrate transporter [Fistulina hepatica ATCC 64428]|nr:MFS general substrate transporter [Fistulina hepatica ATCC 64428]
MLPSRDGSCIRVSISPDSRSGYRETSVTSNRPQALIQPDGPVGEEVVELLNNYSDADNPTGDQDSNSKDPRPWFRRPAAWMLVILPMPSIGTAATTAPRVEIYTILACNQLHPDIFRHTYDDIETDQDLVSGLADGASQVCNTDPAVQAAVAKISTAMALAMGILSCITAGWWGSYSDRHGRLKVLGISILGVLLTNTIFILLSWFPEYAVGGYWFLLVGPFVEGILGGVGGASAAMHAYIADTTVSEARTHWFSLFLGVLFVGMAIGPTLGGLLIHFTGHILSVFWFSIFTSAMYCLLVWLVVPESVSPESMRLAQEAHAHKAVDTSSMGITFLHKIKGVFAFLEPLTLLLPQIPAQRRGGVKPAHWEWSITLVAFSYALVICLAGAVTFQFQYAASTFQWSSEQINYWLSAVGAARALSLLVILPMIIKLLKPAPEILEFVVEDSGSDFEIAMSRHVERKVIHSPTFDLGIAKVSLVIDTCAYILLCMVPTPMVFVGASVMSATGAGFGAAVQSVALDLYVRNGGTETGKLFGAMSVMYSVGMSIIGPSIFGFVYVQFVAIFPRAIFVLGFVLVFSGLLMLTLVRVPDPTAMERDPENAVYAGSESSLVEETPLLRSDVEVALGARGRKLPAVVVTTVDSE